MLITMAKHRGRMQSAPDCLDAFDADRPRNDSLDGAMASNNAWSCPEPLSDASKKSPHNVSPGPGQANRGGRRHKSVGAPQSRASRDSDELQSQGSISSLLPSVQSSAAAGCSPGTQWRLSEEERHRGLKRLAPAEALRQVLLDRAGSLSHAFRKMNVKRDPLAEVTYVDFKAGLDCLGIFGRGSPIPHFARLDEVWEELCSGPCYVGDGKVSLQELLGYVPVRADSRERTLLRSSSGFDETTKQWFNYHNHASRVPSSMLREPRWRARKHASEARSMAPTHGRDRREPDWAATVQSSPEESRRLLRQKLRMVRDGGAIAQRQVINGLTGGSLQAPEDRERRQYNRERQARRLDSYIKDCAASRNELISLKNTMSSIVEPKPKVDTAILSGVLSNFQMAKKSRSAEEGGFRTILREGD